jgi:hypothetical protein
MAVSSSETATRSSQRIGSRHNGSESSTIDLTSPTRPTGKTSSRGKRTARQSPPSSRKKPTSQPSSTRSDVTRTKPRTTVWRFTDPRTENYSKRTKMQDLKYDSEQKLTAEPTPDNCTSAQMASKNISEYTIQLPPICHSIPPN